MILLGWKKPHLAKHNDAALILPDSTRHRPGTRKET